MSPCGTFPLLAFGFGSPWLLLGAALAVIPAILHLVFRREHRSEPFAANRFLAEASRKHSRRLRFQHWILLAVRMSILLLVAIALARPFLESTAVGLATDHPTVHHVFVLDATLSMRHRDRGHRRFDRGRAILERTVEAAHDGDTFRLLVIRGAEPPMVVSQAASRRSEFLEELSRLEPSWESGREIETLQATLAMLSVPGSTGRVRVSLVTDLQRTAWQPPDPDQREQLGTLLESINQNSELVVYDVGGPHASNAAVIDLQPGTSVGIVDEPVTLRATVSHFGPGTSAGELTESQVEWFIDDRMVARRALTLKPNGTTTVEWTHSFSTAGEHHAEVRLSGDGLPEDDSRHIALPVRDRLRVLLAGGRSGNRPEQAATFYVAAALNPEGITETPSTGSPGSPRITTTVIPESRLLGEELDRHDCVVLCDVPRLDQLEISRLTRFVAAGGGLVIGLGQSVDTEAWNRLLGDTGAGLLPGRIEHLVSSDSPDQEPVVFDPGNYTHPLLSIFRGLDGNGLGTAVTLKYLFTSPLPASRIALSYDSGDPAILSRRFGHGRVVLVTTSLDPRWTTWPVLSTSFLPMVHELVRFSTSSRWSSRNHLVGQPITRSVGPLVTGGTLLAPDGISLSMENPASRELLSGQDSKLTDQASGQLISDTPLVPGIYRLSLEPPTDAIESYAITVETSESNLAAAEGQAARTRLSGVDAPIYTRWHDGETPTAFDQPGRPLGRFVLNILLGLLVVELAMAWQFRAGLVALGVLFAAVSLGWWAATTVLLLGCWALRNLYGRHRRPVPSPGEA